MDPSARSAFIRFVYCRELSVEICDGSLAGSRDLNVIIIIIIIMIIIIIIIIIIVVVVVIIIIMMMMMMMMVIAFKGAVRIVFYNLLTAPRTTTSTYAQVAKAQIRCNTSNAYHVQRVVCHLVRRDSSAIKFHRVEITFILASFYWLKPLSNEGREENGAPGANP